MEGRTLLKKDLYVTNLNSAEMTCVPQGFREEWANRVVTLGKEPTGLGRTAECVRVQCQGPDTGRPTLDIR